MCKYFLNKRLGKKATGLVILKAYHEAGQGTTISIKLPLTLAIIPCQIIMMGGERYAIPQVNLEELLRIPANQVKERVELVGNAEVVRLRGNLLPLIRRADVIGVPRTFWNDSERALKSRSILTNSFCALIRSQISRQFTEVHKNCSVQWM